MGHPHRRQLHPARRGPNTRRADAPAPFLPEQALTLAEPLTAYTAGSAWANHLDDITGTIEPGKYADLAVLGRDSFAGPPEEIDTTRVVRTYVEGRQVYAAES
ncbi:amidohydrolase family protein [Streptomyces exfoliatus]|uniref:amidohydrolase family protein n=1 Tax=Streptomyces exfoliatus TaxID=1905 RepID=UPI003C2BDCB7